MQLIIFNFFSYDDSHEPWPCKNTADSNAIRMGFTHGIADWVTGPRTLSSIVFPASELISPRELKPDAIVIHNRTTHLPARNNLILDPDDTHFFEKRMILVRLERPFFVNLLSYGNKFKIYARLNFSKAR
jgi:hypothetical protein